MNFYTTAFQGMPALLAQEEDVMGQFSRDLYPAAFRRYCEKHKETLLAVENGYLQVIDKEQFLRNMAEELLREAVELLDRQPKKGSREKMMADLNLRMVVYIIPSILEICKSAGEPFSRMLLETWKRQFPKSNLQAADFEKINSGFQRKFCYITTAVCRTLGRKDDCYELNLFRNYRDSYLAAQKNGESIVREYYDLAPTIVKHIDRQENADEIYKNIWEDWLLPCLRSIEAGENEKCMILYVSMVRDMQKKYFYKQ